MRRVYRVWETFRVMRATTARLEARRRELVKIRDQVDAELIFVDTVLYYRAQDKQREQDHENHDIKTRKKN